MSFVQHLVHLVRWATTACLLLWFSPSLLPPTASASGALQLQAGRPPSQSADAEAELQAGIALTQQGHFSEAIPHFLAAQGHVRDEYAADFNLALCYVATRQFEPAITLLNSLKDSGRTAPEVNNLLAQAYIGAKQDQKALAAFEQAVAQTPDNEKLYLFLADACSDRQAYDLGLQILDTGLRHLPRSARLHYERGVFLSFENQADSAEAEYRRASKLDPGSDIDYMAAGQAALLEGNIPEAVRVTREGIHSGHENYILLTLFGDAVADSGAASDQPEFAEAQAALQKSIAEHPDYAGSHIALAKLDLLSNRLDDAIAHLESARKLAPGDPSVYSHLAIAYRRSGKTEKLQEVLAILSKLDEAQAAKYKTDSPNKAGYVASGRSPRKPSQDP
ncbi:MAG TPA: tetratricopeptide repeat protein [Candidatus Acidoferrales bacterium]|nr:tetratricopeptide repeat protein [Candidatus Acidoferrales bacterium]